MLVCGVNATKQGFHQYTGLYLDVSEGELSQVVPQRPELPKVSVTAGGIQGRFCLSGFAHKAASIIWQKVCRKNTEDACVPPVGVPNNLRKVFSKIHERELFIKLFITTVFLLFLRSVHVPGKVTLFNAIEKKKHVAQS